MFAIEAKDLSKSFKQIKAVDKVSFRTSKGEVFVLLGPNGAGKTTIVRLLSCLLRPDKGKAIVMGYDISTQQARIRRKIGILTEDAGLYERLNAVEYLYFFGKLCDMSTTEINKRTDMLLKLLGIRDNKDSRLNTFSKGMRQKLALARVLLHDPEILFLDEPTSNLDPESARIVRDYISRLKAQKRTIFLCTHNLDEADRLADTIHIISSGRIVASGTSSELKRKLHQPYFFEIELAHFSLGQERLLLELPGIEQVTNVEKNGKYFLRFATSKPQVTNPQVIETLVKFGISIISFTELETTLEDVYLNVIKEIKDL